MEIDLLPLLATLALYANWKFASPVLPNPTLPHQSGMVRHSPFILFVAAGMLLAVVGPNAGYTPFALALTASMAMMFLAIALAYRLQC
jgi:hypothetical protein